jgi:hypothetical protein
VFDTSVGCRTKVAKDRAKASDVRKTMVDEREREKNLQGQSIFPKLLFQLDDKNQIFLQKKKNRPKKTNNNLS